jgi:6,7-dimethyl-8-ribityllumazine synthase
VGSNPITRFLVKVDILLTSEASDRTIKLNWVHRDASVTNFKLFQDYILLNEPTPTLVNEGGYSNGDVNGFKWSTIISGLTNGREYRFEVIATKQGVDSVQNAAFTTATPYKAPSAPTAAANSFSVDTNTIKLNWGAPTDNGGATTLRYKIEIFDTSGNTQSDADASKVKTNDDFDISLLPFSESSLVNGKSYFAKVYAYYTILNGSSNLVSRPTSTALRIPASGSIKVNQAPPNVDSLVASAKDKAVQLTWTDPSGNVNYPYTTTIVQRSEDNATFVQIGVVPRSGTFTDSNLINGKTYHYKVIAQHSNTGAQQAAGESRSATPAGIPIFGFNNVQNINNGYIDFKLQYNRNGSPVTSCTLIGIDFNGVARVLNVTSLSSQTPMGAAIFNEQSCLPSETYEWTLPRIDSSNRIKDLLFVMNNGAGSAVVSWPQPPNAFDK